MRQIFNEIFTLFSSIKSRYSVWFACAFVVFNHWNKSELIFNSIKELVINVRTLIKSQIEFTKDRKCEIRCVRFFFLFLLLLLLRKRRTVFLIVCALFACINICITLSGVRIVQMSEHKQFYLSSVKFVFRSRKTF